MNEARALKLVMDLMAIPGPSCEESNVAHAITQFLTEHGVPASAVTYDTAHKKTPRPGAIGNLIVKLPGTSKRPRIMRRLTWTQFRFVSAANPSGRVLRFDQTLATTGLGADDRAGVAAVLIAAIESLASKRPMPPLTLCFFVQEEIGLQGSRYLSANKLGKVAMAYNFDGSNPLKLTIGATGGEKLKIVLQVWQPMQAWIRSQAQARSVQRAWPSPHWSAVDGWDKFVKANAKAPATLAQFTEARLPTWFALTSKWMPKPAVTIASFVT